MSLMVLQNWTDLCESGGTGSHQNLSNTIVEAAQGLIVHTQEALSCALFGDFVLQIPNAITMCKFFILCTALYKKRKTKLLTELIE